MDSVNLEFDNPARIYFEGDSIVVTVKIQSEDAKAKPCVTARFLGSSGLKKKVDDDEVFITSEVYIDKTIDLSKDPTFATALSSGDTAGRIEYQLPKKLPTTVEGRNGGVRYSLILTVKSNEDVKKITKTFAVLEKRDSSKYESLPAVMWQPEGQCLCSYLFCFGSHVRVNFYLQKQFYVPGDLFFIEGEINNLHRYPIEWVKFSLVQVIKYKNAKELKEKNIVNEIVRGCIPPYQTQNWNSECFCVPVIPPSSTSRERFVTIKYKLLFQFKAQWQRKPTEFEQTIVIGSSSPTLYVVHSPLPFATLPPAAVTA